MSTFRPHRRASSQLAQMIGDSSVLDVVARDIAARWRAAAPVDKSDFIRSIRVDRDDYHSSSGVTVTDRIVHATDENALSIEYGHFTKGRKRYVPGAYSLQKVVRGFRRAR